MQTMNKRFPITNSGLEAFKFAGFQWPRYVAVLPKGSQAKRLERYRSPVCGPYYHAPKPVAGSKHGTSFYLESDGMPGLRWQWCDKVEGVGRSLDHTGWFTEATGDGDKIRGVVFTLPHGRGFLAGWSMGESMASGLECEVYTDATSAAYAADSMAERLASNEREQEERKSRVEKLRELRDEFFSEISPDGWIVESDLQDNWVENYPDEASELAALESELADGE